MYIATMDTEHFKWLALGSTKATAKKALLAGFDRHLAQYGTAWAEQGCGDSPDEYYGINVVQIKAGECLRDDSQI